jgi:hypothetical protein
MTVTGRKLASFAPGQVPMLPLKLAAIYLIEVSKLSPRSLILNPKSANGPITCNNVVWKSICITLQSWNPRNVVYDQLSRMRVNLHSLTDPMSQRGHDIDKFMLVIKRDDKDELLQHPSALCLARRACRERGNRYLAMRRRHYLGTQGFWCPHDWGTVQNMNVVTVFQVWILEIELFWSLPSFGQRRGGGVALHLGWDHAWPGSLVFEPGKRADRTIKSVCTVSMYLLFNRVRMYHIDNNTMVFENACSSRAAKLIMLYTHRHKE